MTEQEARAEAERRYPVEYRTEHDDAWEINPIYNPTREGFVEGAVWQASRSPVAAPSDTDPEHSNKELSNFLAQYADDLGVEHPSRGCIGCPICSARSMMEIAAERLASQPVPVEVTDAEVVQVFWYEHDCEWVSKYCDEHHQRSAWVSRAALGGGE